MRKFVAVVAAVMLSASIATPAEAVAAGQKCGTRLAVVKVGTAKLYCGKNTNKRTAARSPLVWKRSVDCFDLISAYNNVQRDYDSAIKQIEEIKKQISAVSGDTTGLQATVKGFEDTVKVFEPTVTSMRQQVRALCG